MARPTQKLIEPSIWVISSGCLSSQRLNDTSGYVPLIPSKNFHMLLSHRDQSREQVLLEFCKKNQGPAITGLNSRIAPGATTYRSEFCDAASDLFRLYANAGIKSPLVRMTLVFNELNIRSCRGSDMSPSVMSYFYEKHLAKRLKKKPFLLLHKILKEPCPICGKRKANLNEHLQMVHGVLADVG